MQNFNFFPFTWSYNDELVDDTIGFRNVIRVSGWNEKNESVQVVIQNFNIPIWLELPRHIEWTNMRKDVVINKIMSFNEYIRPQMCIFEEKHKLYYGEVTKVGDTYERKKFPYLCVAFKTLRALEEFKKEISKGVYFNMIGNIKMKCHCHERSITPVLKLMAFRKLPSSGWIAAKGHKVSEDEKDSTKMHEYICSYKNLKKIEDTSSLPIVYPKVLSFDLEAYSSVETAMPNSKKPADKVFQIGCCLLEQTAKEKKYTKYLLSLGELNPIEGVSVLTFKTEDRLYKGFINLVKETNPDVIIGYNIFGWDIGYMNDRMACLYGINFDGMSCVPSKKATINEINWESSAYGKQDLKYIEAEGRMFIDLLPYIKRNYKLSNYRLETVCSEFLKDSNKDPLKAKDIFNCYKKFTPASLSLVGKYCFTEDTNVSLKYKSVNIKKLKNNSYPVLSYDETKKGLVYSKQVNYFDNGEHECVEIEMIDGTKMTCTNDHKILVENDMWKEAQKLDVKYDKIKCGLIFPSVNIEEEFEVCKDIDFGLFKINNIEDMEKGYAYCRLLGYALTDGHISKQRCDLHVGSKVDINDIVEDIKLVSGTKEVSVYKSKYTYKIHCPIIITKSFNSLKGIVINKRTTQESSIPEFIINAPKPFLREFLGALFGGDGHTPCLNKKENKFTQVAFSQTIEKNYATSLISTLNTYKTLLEKFGIETSVSNEKLPGGSNENYCSIQMTIKKVSQIDFENYIGFRYCYHKSIRLRIANIHYKIRKDKISLYNNILYEIKEKVKNGTTKEFACNSVMDKYKEYKLPSKRTFQKRFDTGFEGYIFTNGIERDCKLFLKEIGAENLFYKDNYTVNEKCYSIKKDDEIIPTFFIPIKSIQNVGKKHVYDIEVERTHNFIANGMIVHNCAQDAYVTLQVYEKLLIWFDLVESATTNGVPIIYLYTKGQQIKMYSQLLTYCVHNNIVVESNAYTPKETDRYTGAYVSQPIAGLYKTIIPFDFASLYPSIIMAYNIDYSKLVIDENIPDEDCHVFEWEEEQEDLEEQLRLQEEKEKEKEKEVITDEKPKRVKKVIPMMKVKHKFRFLKIDRSGKGVVPTLLENLIKARKSTRKLIEENQKRIEESKDEDEIKRLEELNLVLDKRQLAYKVSANSMYGAMGVKKGYLPFPQAAMCVTYVGRQSIHKASNFLETECGGKVIYNDTDSAYTYFECLKGKPMREIWEYVENVVKKVEVLFPKPMKLEFEGKVYTKFLILTKKRYLAQMADINGNVSSKLVKRGIVLQRRDNCQFLRDVYQNTVNDLLDGIEVFTDIKTKDNKEKIPEVCSLLNNIIYNIDELFQMKYSYKSFVITKSLSKLPEDYKSKTIPVHAYLAAKMKKRGVMVQIGSRIEYLLLDSGRGYDKNELQQDKVEDVTYFSEFRDVLRLDYLYYLRSQVVKPLDELLSVCLGIDKFMDMQLKLRIQKSNFNVFFKKSINKTILE